MKKNILSKISLLALVFCLIFALSGCNSKNNNSDNNKKDSNGSSKETMETSKEDLKVFDYIAQIKPENTVEEINNIVGSEGKLIDEKYNKYSWEITEDTTLTATYYSSKTATIAVSINDDLLKNSKTDLSGANDLKSAINSKDGVKYEEFAQKFGSEGYVVEKTSTSTSYRWVSEKGGYIKASFSNSSNKCTFFSGMIK